MAKTLFFIMTSVRHTGYWILKLEFFLKILSSQLYCDRAYKI